MALLGALLRPCLGHLGLLVAILAVLGPMLGPSCGDLGAIFWLSCTVLGSHSLTPTPTLTLARTLTRALTLTLTYYLIFTIILTRLLLSLSTNFITLSNLTTAMLSRMFSYPYYCFHA